MFAQRARDNLACVAFCGLVGGQDELVFDGHSCVDRPHRRARSPAPPSSARSCSSATSTSTPPPPRACATRSHRPAARRSERSPRCCRRSRRRRRRRRERRRAPAADWPSRSSPSRPRSTRALTLGLRDYVAQERLRSTSCSASPAGSTPRSSPASPSTRSARSASAPRSCPRPTPPPTPRTTRARSPRALGVRAHELPIEPRHARLRAGARGRRSPGASPTSPRRTCRRASAATC